MIEWILLILLIVGVVVFVLPGLALIGANEVGILTRKMFGLPLPDGQIIATKGEVGVQAETLMPGLYWRFPLFWSIEKVAVTSIAPGTIGIVESIDGKPLAPGRLLGDEIECDAFQNATKFLETGGYKGLQIGILRPGTYRINTKVFKIKSDKATVIPKDNVGIVVALDGNPLPSNLVIATPPVADHRHFQNGQDFINHGGFRGTQLETLQPGDYYINTFLFDVSTVAVAVVPPGYVGVIISSVGADVEQSEPAPAVDGNPNLAQPIITSREVPLITNKNQRGILRDPVMTGKYNLNTIAYKVELVPTSAVTVKWGTEEPASDSSVLGVNRAGSSQVVNDFYTYNQLRATAKDGFQLDVDVKLIIRIPPANAPYVISRFGNVNNLIEQVVHPLIDSTFRNEAGNSEAMSFIHSRTSFQETSLKKAQDEFAKYHVEVQGLLIAYIKVDEALLDTQTKKQIAVQQQQQYVQEALAQEQRIAVAEKTARAEKQKDVIAAKLAIDIAQDNATALVNQAVGIRDSTKTQADGKAYEAQKIGEGQAAAYKAQTDVIGKGRVALIRALDTIGQNDIIVTPRINVSGGAGAGTDGNAVNGGLIMNTLFAQMLDDKLDREEQKEKDEAVITAPAKKADPSSK